MRLTALTIRAIDWAPLLAAAALALLIAAVAAPDANVTLLTLRASGVVLGAAAAFALVDPMAASTAALPRPRWRRQWLRCLLALALAMPAAAGCCAIAALRLPAAQALPLPGVALELATTIAVGLAVGAVAVRRLPGRGAALAGAIAQATVIAATFALRGGASPWPDAGDPRWSAAHQPWAVALPVALVLIASANRDLVRYPGGRTGRPPG
jgi:hypothetical protein